MADYKKLAIYHSLKNLRDKALEYAPHINKHFRYTLGERLINKIFDLNGWIRIANEQEDTEKRINDIRQIRFICDELEYMGDACKKHEVLTEDRLECLLKEIGEVGRQATAWLNYYKSQNKNDKK